MPTLYSRIPIEIIDRLAQEAQDKADAERATYGRLDCVADHLAHEASEYRRAVDMQIADDLDMQMGGMALVDETAPATPSDPPRCFRGLALTALFSLPVCAIVAWLIWRAL
jgi:hypothetical protein